MPAAIRLPTVYSSGPSPGSTSRPVRRLSTARTPIVRPLVTSGVPRNELTSSRRGKGAVALVRIVVDVAEQERPVRAGELRQQGIGQVDGDLELGDRGGHLRAAADRPAMRQEPALLVGQQDERAVEAAGGG